MCIRGSGHGSDVIALNAPFQRFINEKYVFEIWSMVDAVKIIYHPLLIGLDSGSRSKNWLHPNNRGVVGASD